MSFFISDPENVGSIYPIGWVRPYKDKPTTLPSLWVFGCAAGMAFAEDLWCPQGHAALMKLQDSELRLMEVMKKWMTQRAKSDREFSTQLHQMSAMVEKLEGSQSGGGLDYISQFNKVGTVSMFLQC